MRLISPQERIAALEEEVKRLREQKQRLEQEVDTLSRVEVITTILEPEEAATLRDVQKSYLLPTTGVGPERFIEPMTPFKNIFDGLSASGFDPGVKDQAREKKRAKIFSRVGEEFL